MKDLNAIEAQLTRVLSFFPRVDAKVGGLFTVNSAVLTISALNVQAGDLIRNNNDLIWIGRPPSFAAKLSDNREYPYCTFISAAVYDAMLDEGKLSKGVNMWEKRSMQFAGADEDVYRSNYQWTP